MRSLLTPILQALVCPTPPFLRQCHYLWLSLCMPTSNQRLCVCPCLWLFPCRCPCPMLKSAMPNARRCRFRSSFKCLCLRSTSWFIAYQLLAIDYFTLVVGDCCFSINYELLCQRIPPCLLLCQCLCLCPCFCLCPCLPYAFPLLCLCLSMNSQVWTGLSPALQIRID